MKILQITNKVPWPEKDGGALCVSAFTQALLQAGQEVTMLAMNTSKHLADLNAVPQKIKEAISLDTVYVDTSVNFFSALLSLFRGISYNVSRFISAGFNAKLASILQHEAFDIIQLEGLYLTPYIKTIRQYSFAPVVLRQHNIEWMIWKRLADEEKNKVKRAYLKILTKQLKRYEESAINLCDGIATLTVNDREQLKKSGCKVPVTSVPFGVDTTKYKIGEAKEKKSLFFIGALDWMPNVQGLDWFLLYVWPALHGAYPNLLFHVAGRNMPQKYKAKTYPGVVFHGEVESAAKFMGEYAIMVVPLLAGSGIRVKIIEGMAMCKPIVTTHVGVQGIECIYGNDIIVADTPTEFCGAVKKLLDNPSLAESVAENAKKFVETTHHIKTLTANLLLFYTELMTLKRS